MRGRRGWIGAVAVATALALVSAGCGSRSAAQPADPGVVSDFWQVLAASRDLGHVSAGRTLSLPLVLRPRAGADPRASLGPLYDPSSPEFGRYLSSAQYDARFGPDPDQVRGLQDAARGMGLDLTWQPGAVAAILTGPAGTFERELGVRVDDYRGPDGRGFYAAPTRPTLPEPLRGAVLPVDRLTDWHPPLRTTGRLAAVRPGGVTPNDLALAYDFKQLHDKSIDGSGETVVFWELADGFNQADFDAFNKKFNLPPAQVQVIGPADAPSQGETIMDIEAVHAVAPGAKLVVYTLGAGQNLDDQVLMQAVDRTIRENPGAILSYSWGGCEPGQGAAMNQWFESEFTKADQLGESIYVSTGDSGGYECLSRRDSKPLPRGIGTSMPASASGVTAVGGTRLSLSRTGAWYSEVPWKWETSTGGTGGGVSQVFPRPSWQRGPGVANRWNPRGMRSVPDVSAIGDPASGLSIIEGGLELQGGGTSLSTPIWSGITALLNQYLKQQGLKPVGFFNPAIYAIAAGHPPYPAFHDQTVGGNLVYPATSGYDLASGWGTPDVWNLARDVERYQRDGGRI
jgi:kumamolisin